MTERLRPDDPIGAALRRAFADERAPLGLQQRLAGALRAAPRSVGAPPFSRRLVVAALGAIAVILFGIALLRPGTTNLSDVPLKELQAFIDSNRAVDVATDDPARLRAWLAQRIDFTPPPAARGDGEIELIGGRLCLFSGRRVASYMYRVHGRLLSIYVMSADGLTPTGVDRFEHAGRSLAVTREGHLSQASWKENGLVYSMVAELPPLALLHALDGLRR
jgi:anti-sigma factor RsiW